MLKIEQLSVCYGKIQALNSISLQVREKEIVALIGANGAGKTSTLMAICNVVEKTEGRISFKEEDITHSNPSRIIRKGIAHIPEGRHIFPRMTVEENLMIGSVSNNQMTKAQLREGLEEQYELFPRLKERRRQMGETLSGGEQQMLAIARGLIANPTFVMFDEPSMGLAPIICTEIFNMILRIRKMGKTILLIEQNANMALSIADRAYLLETGKIVMTGKGQELLEDEDVKKAYLGI